MPKRVGTQRRECDDVQGEGSYVKLSSVKVREVRVLRKMSRDSKLATAKREAILEKDPFAEVPPELEAIDAFQGGLDQIGKHVMEWNWVDDEGEPLPLPKDDIDVLEDLTNEEVEFLIQVLIGDDDAKNSESG